ncbi:MAG: class I SAM-dependent methyltransferase [Alphaproteobacteria bacterium]|nr:class I SAM-dependent methyltransferase [Alphaproteobacteria bacterium]
MSAEVNLLARLPVSKRNIEKRKEAKDPEVVRIAREFGETFFDGPRDYGYGGYGYDGRWRPVAEDIVAHFGLKPGERVLDVGCAKGFLVADLMAVCPGLEVFGLDISDYAVRHCHPDVIGRLHVGSADDLPFPDASFDCVLSINTLHNLPRPRLITALREIDRLSGARSFVQVDSYHDARQKEIFESWVLTAEFHDYPSGWLALFAEAGYRGDHAWTVIG